MLSGKRSDYFQFKDWLAARQRHFDEVNASPADIADLAIKDGFPEPLIRQWQQHKRWENMGNVS
jgi:hypothetical protein